MQKLKTIENYYPDLYNQLKKQLPVEFFESPESVSSHLKRRYNNILSEYMLIQYGDYRLWNALQLLVSA